MSEIICGVFIFNTHEEDGDGLLDENGREEDGEAEQMRAHLDGGLVGMGRTKLSGANCFFSKAAQLAMKFSLQRGCCVQFGVGSEDGSKRATGIPFYIRRRVLPPLWTLAGRA